MSELEDYDSAAHKFYSSLKINPLPIVSWDFYGEFFDKICKDYNDITILTRLAKSKQWSYTKKRFSEELLGKAHVIVVTDPQLTIVHATQNIFGMSGYKPKDVLGKKPKMFQGEGTCRDTSKRIRIAINNKIPFEETLLNYRKNGTTYKCCIKGEPIFNTSGEVVNFIAYEKEVA